MPVSITPISPAIAPIQPAALGKTGNGEAFSSFLKDAISQANAVQQNSQSSVEKFLAGEDEDVHKVALATQEAEISFDLFMQVRNKVIQAYQQVMQMQI